jgi:protein-disulfide isomerase
MQDRLERALSIVLTVAAAAIAVAFVHREVQGPRKPAAAAVQPPQYLPDWRSLATAGILVGDSAARIKVVEFADFECPYCRTADSVYRDVKKQFGADVALVFIHYPLRMHRFALPAARAAECANEQGRFGEFHDALYSKQDSLGLKSWSSYARDAGVPDIARFGNCTAATTQLARVNAGLALGKRVGVRGTPTVIVNGWRFSTPPQMEEFTHIIHAVLAGKDPFPPSRSAAE